MTSTEQVDSSPSAPAAPPGGRMRARRGMALALGVGLIVSGGAWGHRWYEFGRFQETTDDAYVAADAVPISPRIAGQVVEVDVADNQTVSKGTLLARIDDRDYRVAAAQAAAELAEGRAGLDASDAQVAEQRSVVTQAQADVDGGRAEFNLSVQEEGRARSLSASGYGTGQSLDRATSTLRQRAASLQHAQAALEAALSKTQTQEASRAYAVANLAKVQADMDKAALNLGYTEIRAPVDGIVGDRSIRLGAYVQAGTGLMTIVPTGRALYVTANLKETQVGHVRPGQPVAVVADAFGGHVFHGRVSGVSPGTGAQFALLQPENATGNFTKIVQRVPVRIELDPGDPRIDGLRAGLSVSVTVNTLEGAGADRGGR